MAYFGCRVGPRIASEPNCVRAYWCKSGTEFSGKLFVGLAGSDFKFAVAKQVIVPNDTVTFVASEASTTTTMVVSFAELVQLAGGNVSFRIALRVRAEVLCGKNTMIRKGLQMGHNDCPNTGIGQVEGRHEGEPWLHFW